MTNVTIRDFVYERADYETVVAIENAVYPDYALAVENWMHWDRIRDPKIKNKRLMLDVDGVSVGMMEYDQSVGYWHPQKFMLRLAILPEHQGKGYGKRLYGHMRELLAKHNPISIKAEAREDMVRSVRFLEDREFEVVQKSWESRLDPTVVKLDEWAHYADRMESLGIVIKTMVELEGDEDRNQKMYELLEELAKDIPSTEPRTPVSYETWAKRFFDSPNLDPNSQFFALDGEIYVGYSSLWLDQTSDHLWTGLTGVKRGYRKQGVASALKIRAVSHALDVGCPRINTWNEVNNQGMLGINERLGYVKQPVWLDYQLTIREGD